MSTTPPTEDVAIDDDLRAFMAQVAERLDRYEDGERDAIPAGDDALQGEGFTAGWEAEDRLRFRYDHEGYRWGFSLTPLLVRLVASGDIQALPMEPLQPLGEPGEPEVPDALMAAIASLVGGEEAPAPPSDVAQLGHARSFLDLLLANEVLELVEGANLGKLARGIIPFLSEEGRAYQRAEALLDWLIDQEEVDEVFLGEDELARLLKNW